MAILHIASLGQRVLRKTARPIEENELENSSMQSFMGNLLESMLFHDGVGLAAPQVFRSQRIIAVCVPDELDDEGNGLDPTVFINPRLENRSETLVEGWEGCLSLRDLRGIVPRSEAVTLVALDRNGKRIEKRFKGFVARVLQHEVDHLDGIVFPDRMTDLSSLGFEKDLTSGQVSESDE